MHLENLQQRGLQRSIFPSETISPLGDLAEKFGKKILPRFKILQN